MALHQSRAQHAALPCSAESLVTETRATGSESSVTARTSAATLACVQPSGKIPAGHMQGQSAEPMWLPPPERPASSSPELHDAFNAQTQQPAGYEVRSAAAPVHEPQRSPSQPEASAFLVPEQGHLQQQGSDPTSLLRNAAIASRVEGTAADRQSVREAPAVTRAESQPHYIGTAAGRGPPHGAPAADTAMVPQTQHSSVAERSHPPADQAGALQLARYQVTQRQSSLVGPQLNVEVALQRAHI